MHILNIQFPWRLDEETLHCVRSMAFKLRQFAERSSCYFLQDTYLIGFDMWRVPNECVCFCSIGKMLFNLIYFLSLICLLVCVDEFKLVCLYCLKEIGLFMFRFAFRYCTKIKPTLDIKLDLLLYMKTAFNFVQKILNDAGLETDTL